MTLARLLPLFVVLLLLSCFSAQAGGPVPNRADVRSSPPAGADLDMEALPWGSTASVSPTPPWPTVTPPAGSSFVIVHALNPEGIEIASIEGMSPYSVQIYDGDTLIGYGAHDNESCNEPIAISPGAHNIKAEFNGMTLERNVNLEPGETKVITFTFGRTEMNIQSILTKSGTAYGTRTRTDVGGWGRRHMDVWISEQGTVNGTPTIDGLIAVCNAAYGFSGTYGITYTITHYAEISYTLTPEHFYAEGYSQLTSDPPGGAGFHYDYGLIQQFLIDVSPMFAADYPFGVWFVQNIIPSYEYGEAFAVALDGAYFVPGSYPFRMYEGGYYLRAISAGPAHWISTGYTDYVYSYYGGYSNITRKILAKDLKFSSVPYDLTGTGIQCEEVKCQVPPGGGITEPIPEGLSCGEVTTDVLLHTREDEVGNKVQLFCADRAPFVDEFDLEYVPVGQSSRQVGRCPWAGGQNEGTITHAGDTDTHEKVHCFLRTFWRSVEPGEFPDADQGEPDLIDWKTYDFDVQTGRLVLKHFASVDGPGGEHPDKLIKKAEDVDPLAFNPDPPPNGEPMITVAFDPCDTDRDGDCDADDFDLLRNALGQTEDGDNYNEVADADHDGSVTLADQQALFGSDGDGDAIPDVVDNCQWVPNPGQEDRHVPPNGIGDHCDDPDSDGFTDYVELYVGTDPDDACPEDPSDDAWPPDINVDTWADIVDVLLYKPVIMTQVGNPAYNPRFDLNADGDLDIVDVLLYKPVIMTQCTNP